jgi:hypothetical protein
MPLHGASRPPGDIGMRALPPDGLSRVASCCVRARRCGARAGMQFSEKTGAIVVVKLITVFDFLQKLNMMF